MAWLERLLATGGSSNSCSNKFDYGLISTEMAAWDIQPAQLTPDKMIQVAGRRRKVGKKACLECPSVPSSLKAPRKLAIDVTCIIEKI